MLSRYINVKIIFVIFFVAFLSFAIFWQIDKRIRADEWLWVPHGVRFVDALFEGNLAKTKVSARPGVTVTWISGATTRLSQKIFEVKVLRIKDWVFVSQQGYVLNRIAFGVITIILLLGSFLLLSRLIEWQKAALVLGIVSTHQFTLLGGNIVWTDLFLAIFIFLSVVSFLLFYKQSRGVYLVLSGIFFGLAIATKTAAVVILPGIFFSYYLANPTSLKVLKRAFLYTLAVAFFGLAFFYLIYPYLWVKLSGVFDRYSEFSEVLVAAELDANPNTIYSPFFYLTVLFKTNPILTGFSGIFAAFAAIRSMLSRKIDLTAVLPLIVSLIYLGVLLIVSQFTYLSGVRIASTRYIVPVLYLLGLFLVASIPQIAQSKYKMLWLLPVAAILYNLYDLIYYFPYEVGD